MRAIVKLFVVWTLGLAVLFASPAVSLAGPPPTPRVTFCGCTCVYYLPLEGGGFRSVVKGVTFATDRSCSIFNHQTCYCNGQTCYLKPNAGAGIKAELRACEESPPMIQGEPPANVLPGGMKPPANVLPPAVR
jgi:hypothetical protein